MNILNLTINHKYSKQIEYKKPIITNLLISWYNNKTYEFIGQTFKASWFNLNIYPRIWINSVKDTPNFKHYSITIRWGWWYFGVQKKFKTDK